MTKTMRNTSLVILVAAGALSLQCGGGDGPVSAVEITVSYPGQAAEVSTNSLHFWILEARTEDAPGCRDLQLGEADPYDLVFDRHADFVVITAEAASGSIDEVPRRPVMVYAEGVDYAGEAHLAGCQAVELGAATESVAITLISPGTFDCADPETENGAACDDGMFCTVGETCQSGTCQGGGPRNCTHVADECNAEACSEQLGCHPTPVPNGRPCEDGAYCTAPDTCQDGVCQPGGPRDCSSADGVCRTGTCDESVGRCVSEIDSQLDCDDGLYCTQVDSCTISGSCQGTSPVDCSIADNDCNVGQCSEAMMGACEQVPINQSGSCDTNCTVGGTCNAGVCEGGTPQAVATTEGPMGDATCSDFVDNDCDGDFDADDADCQ